MPLWQRQEVQEVLREESVVARDERENRYVKKQQQEKLSELARRGLSKEEIEAEEQLLREAKEVRAKDPDKYQLSAEKQVGRNDPCPCGSGKKYKKCCGKGK